MGALLGGKHPRQPCVAVVGRVRCNVLRADEAGVIPLVELRGRRAVKTASDSTIP